MVSTPPHLRSVIDRDGAVILDIPANEMTTLNSTGAFIWEQLQKGQTPAFIAAELARDTDTPEAVIARDVDAFIESLLSKHLLLHR